MAQDLGPICALTINASTLVFETCLRTIRISPWGEQIQAREAHEVLAGPEAYAFLLEVLTGLKSPVFGETEVFAQFKNFWEKTQLENSSSSYFAPWARFLIEDVKKIRSEFFRDSTTLTWGGVVRKTLRPFESVWILGNGELGLSVAASLKNSDLVFWARREKPGLPGRHHDLSAPPTPESRSRALVICAPLSDQEVQKLADLKPASFQYMMDLREAQHRRLACVDFDLKDIDSLSELHRHRSQDIQVKAQSRILELTEKSWDSLWHRPFGWEELCG